MSYRIRVFINDHIFSYVDLGPITIPWADWLAGLQAYRGIAHDKGYIPIEAIKFIVHLDAQGEPAIDGGNVVRFRRPT